MNNPKLLIGLVVIAVIGIACYFASDLFTQVQQVPGVGQVFKSTNEAQIAKYGADARARLEPLFKNQGLKYPPDKLAMLAIKSTKELMVYTATGDNPYQYVCTYPITAISGTIGPKMKVGDLQIPEGQYLLSLEPNSPYHLALKLNYPNDADQARAREENRDASGDVFIQGGNVSKGSIAVGDRAIEDLYIMVADVTDKNVPLLISPVDFRTQQAPSMNSSDPAWLQVVYGELRNAMFSYPKPDTW